MIIERKGRNSVTTDQLDQIDQITAVATNPSNANASEYMRGMANGLILAKSILDQAEPRYILPRPGGIIDSDGTLQAMIDKARV